MSWYHEPAATPSDTHRHSAEQRQAQLTKPAGSMGQLETVAVKLASLQATDQPACDNVGITIFAADHGVASEGVSAFPQSVTAQMVQNFSTGGAAIAVLAKSLNARLDVINVGTVTELPELKGVSDQRIAAGTANFTQKAAMSSDQLQQALRIGQTAILAAKEAGSQLWIGGEMGIANTTSATALACAYLKKHAAEIVGPGTGLDNAGQIHKSAVIHRALDVFDATSQQPLKNLQYLGGFEIAALTGAYLAAAQVGLPALVDGFICSVAALYAQAINPTIKPWLILSHKSAEPGHQAVLRAFDQKPLLDLDLRLGEGSGAASAVPLLRLACDLHNQMATFEHAGVDAKG
ncbi:nicotinate-nucleotide--dimethylbenzimidazole phosphoribosyltransferase [Aestuariicella hydrocarbonica]|uniref:Nicotinate-nucleotide--dimethylbenzimidazole phosphoribosyltransferase n=1 Tax=Pseudomaricurvus hydrocarbonicus TaxID=1470433 RepID=A0A9E5MG59_9GAMM|nr:nicotinate-nucleotide--dimethylbenzimidazole phosphoribosyltransferase [Aestuariicella hydrocarbonica]NHO64251.1 nicotinate-nucleotide--dimethylbenzimidazole phosphoribosyltransferase [Aestuariicella hydrocarbonica]